MFKQLYLRVIYNLKKILCSLHQRLQLLIVVQQETNNQNQTRTLICLQPFEDNQSQYSQIFKQLNNFSSQFKDKLKRLKAVAKILQSHINTLTKCQLKPGEKEDGKFYANSKSLLCLFLLHDPIINKVIINFSDKVIKWLDKNEQDGQMSEAAINLQCEVEDIRGFVDEIQSFSTKKCNNVNESVHNLCKNQLALRWVDCYHHLFDLNMFRIHVFPNVESAEQPKILNIKKLFQSDLFAKDNQV